MVCIFAPLNPCAHLFQVSLRRKKSIRHYNYFFLLICFTVSMWGCSCYLWLEVPEHQVVDCSTGSKGVSVFAGQLVRKSTGVGADLLRVLLELLSGDLLQLGGYAGDLVHVRPTFSKSEYHLTSEEILGLNTRQTLKPGENSSGDLGLEVSLIFSVENNSRAGSSERFVSCGGDNICELEGIGSFTSGNQS